MTTRRITTSINSNGNGNGNYGPIIQRKNKSRTGMLAAAVMFGFVALLTLETFRRSISVYGTVYYENEEDPTLHLTTTASAAALQITDHDSSQRQISSQDQQEKDSGRAQALQLFQQEQESFVPLPKNYSPYLPTTSETHVNETSTDLDPNFQPTEEQLEITVSTTQERRKQPFKLSYCVPWTTNADEWWAHRPTWEQGLENETHYCFNIITDSYTRKIHQQIYQIQFQGNCSNVYTKRMWNSGWNAALLNVIDGLNHVLKKQRPVQIVESRWFYADPSVKPTPENRGVPPACPRANMFCFFLPISNCQPAPTGARGSFLEESRMETTKRTLLYDYATRPQTWLRKAIYVFMHRQETGIPIVTPCAVIHCRRGDVLSDTGNHIRRYHRIEEYIEAAKSVLHKNILLLTDDQNAVAEAKTEFPDYNWMYIDRPRYRGNEGGWERHIPSNDASFEVVVLLSTFKLAAKHCSQFVFSNSGFAGLLSRHMSPSTRFFDLDAGKKKSQIFNKKNLKSLNVSLAYAKQQQQAGDEEEPEQGDQE